jgi:hypothetical protein
MSDEGRQNSDDVKAFTEEDVAQRSALGIRWFRGESLATIAQTEGLDVEAVEGLLRGLMKGVHAVSRRERDEARAKGVEYIGETRRLRRLAAHVAKGGFGEGALVTVVVDECENGLRFHRFTVTAPTLDEVRIAEAFRPHIEAMLARCGEVAKVSFEYSGLGDLLDEEIEGARPQSEEAST